MPQVVINSYKKYSKRIIESVRIKKSGQHSKKEIAKLAGRNKVRKVQSVISREKRNFVSREHRKHRKLIHGPVEAEYEDLLAK